MVMFYAHKLSDWLSGLQYALNRMLTDIRKYPVKHVLAQA
jgi:hypothetical protein